MAYEAAFWRPDSRPDLEQALADPDIARYVPVPGRVGHDALIAIVGEQPAGSAWSIVFSADEPGYGFAGPGIPELGVAVDEPFRRRGIGEALIRALLARASARGLEQMSLSVNADNPSARIYRRVGFREVSSEDGSWVMLAHAKAP